MKCNEVRDNLSLYIDDELSHEEKELMNEHLKKCPECMKELGDYKNIIQVLNELPDSEPPEGYCKRLHKKLLETKILDENVEEIKVVDMPKKKGNNRSRWIKYGSVAAALALVFLVSSLNNGILDKSYNKMELAYDASDAAPRENSIASPAETPMSGSASDDYKIAEVETQDLDKERLTTTEESTGQANIMMAEKREMKIIKTGNIYVQTKDYNKFLDDITSKIDSLGGLIENNNTEVYQVYNTEKLMRGYLKIRVPQESFYETVKYLEETTEVRRKNINEADVTKEYYEKDNKVKNLEIQEQHLRELFDKATTVEEMLQIENELRRIRTEIDGLNISLADINDRSSMSTIVLDVEEVKEVNLTLKGEESIWERAREGFVNTVNAIVREIGNFIVNLVSLVPVLIPAAVIFVILFRIIKKYWKK